MTTKTKMTRSEAGRLGGQATARKHGRDHLRTIAAKGAATTNTRHAHQLGAWGKAGLDVRLERRWNGDLKAYGEWLSAKGNFATDPFPANGAFPDPGPEPIPVEELLDRDFITCTR